MFWVDEIVENILKEYPGKKKFRVRDEKTLSGRVHIGSLRGVIIHAIIAQALNENGVEAEFVYEFNDADPMDGLPVYLDQEKFEKHMGKPLQDVPSPNEESKNYPSYFGEEFLAVIKKIGFDPKIIWASDCYNEGLYDKWIEIALNNKDEIRAIYKEVSGSEKPEDWYPLQVVCENCGKVGTTKVIGWDGKEVEYECLNDLVTWAKGCSHKGKTSPFKGKGKLPWKVEWPTKWHGLEVDIEGSGKDHCAAGGSHEIGERIIEEIYKGKTPFNIPYEFFLLGGAKMSSSKGMGASVKEISDIVPPEILRFLMVREWPNHPIEFNPIGDTLLRLYDKHDEAATHYFEEVDEVSRDLQRIYYFSQLDPKNIEKKFFPRFSRIAFMTQIPHLDIVEECKKLKGADLTEADKKEIEERVHFAKLWLKSYAPEAYKFEIQEDTPETCKELADDQKEFLNNLANLIEQHQGSGEELHGKIHELRKSSEIQAKAAFQAIYIALLGRTSGPQAGWFLESLEKDFVVNRFKQASGS